MTEENRNKAVITVVGKDTVGIIARICTYLANNRVNIEDISQTIVQDYFNMMMIVDVSQSNKPFEDPEAKSLISYIPWTKSEL